MITVQRKQFPGILGHAMTVHKSQGSTLEYMKGDLNRNNEKKTKTGKEYLVPISQGQLYTLLSRAKSRDKLLLLNFEPDHIKVNLSALEEMNRMRKDALFEWKHPLEEMVGSNICLFNIRSWNAHIEHFLCDKVYLDYCDIFCFTETHLSATDSRIFGISQYAPGWCDIHKNTDHGLAICFNSNKVKLIEEFQITSSLEMLPVLIETQNEFILLVLVYRTGPVGSFVNSLIEEMRNLPQKYRTLVVGDFNLDLVLPENIQRFAPLISEFSFNQQSKYTTHNHGGILDLVFDTSDSAKEISWIPSPYSDHFVMLIPT